MSAITRRAALAGATALAITAALPAVSLAKAGPANAVRDVELLAVVDDYFATSETHRAVWNARCHAFARAVRRPEMAHVSSEEILQLQEDSVFGGDEAAKAAARARLQEVTFLDCGVFTSRDLPEGTEEAMRPLGERIDAFAARLKDLEARLATMPARTPAGVQAKLRIVKGLRDGTSSALFNSAITDLKRMAAGNGRTA
jgi:hypothetical protein